VKKVERSEIIKTKNRLNVDEDDEVSNLFNNICIMYKHLYSHIFLKHKSNYLA
jgi:hypothetical protein